MSSSNSRAASAPYAAVIEEGREPDDICEPCGGLMMIKREDPAADKPLAETVRTWLFEVLGQPKTH